MRRDVCYQSSVILMCGETDRLTVSSRRGPTFPAQTHHMWPDSSGHLCADNNFIVMKEMRTRIQIMII